MVHALPLLPALRARGRTVGLNGLLLFVILLYVYPLRFLVGFQMDMLFGRLSGPEIAEVLTVAQAPWLGVIYSAGYAAVFGLFALLYRHAGQQAAALGLSPVERVMTRQRVAFGWVHVGVAASVMVLSLALPARLAPAAGGLYFALWPLIRLAARPYRRELRALTSADG